MGTHLSRRKEAGQSIILIAFVIAVLVGMVGLSVDVGKAYAEQRAAQRAVNSAAIKAVDSMIKGSADTVIYEDIVQSLKANGISVVARGETPGPGEKSVSAVYLNEKGDVVGDVGDTYGTRTPDQDVFYVQVKLEGTTETYLARLFGRDTLPVDVNTYGGRAPCYVGVYPFAVQDNVFSTQPENDYQGGVYNDNIYRNKQWRRVYLKDNSPLPGGFSWLRWKEDKSSGSASQQKLDLTGDGTIDEGFNEAPWQSGTAAGTKPQNYPYLPGYINNGDWVWGSTGLVNSVKDQLDWHITNRTEMLLPRFDVAAGNGSNGAYHIVGIDRYLLRGYGNDNEYQGNPHYLDLVYLGSSNGCATLIHPPVPEDRLVSLVGEVQVKPRYTSQAPDQPVVDLLFVIDESYSMLWKWHNNTNGVDNINSPDARRDTIVRDVLKKFVDDFMTADDRMAIMTYTGNTGQIMPYPVNKTYTQADIDNAVKSLTDVLAPYTKGDTAGKSLLKTQIDKYKADGNTPSVVGLEAGWRMLKGTHKLANGTAVPGPDTQRIVGVAPNQRTAKVKKVLVFMTDGVANTYIDGKFRKCNDGGTTSENCVDELKGENQPIDQLGDLANDLKAAMGTDLTIYTIAMGPLFDQTGLINTASQPKAPWFNTADQISDMQPIFSDIKSAIKEGDCQPNEEAIQPPTDRSRINDDGKIGEVTLVQDGNVVGGPVSIMDQNGKATYTFANVKPGTYTLKGWVQYKGKDNVFRVYSLVSKGDEVWGSQVSFQVKDETGLGTYITGPRLTFDLATGVCAAP